MANPILLKRSTTAGNVPPSLAGGELAVNIPDRLGFFADNSGTIRPFNLTSDAEKVASGPIANALGGKLPVATDGSITPSRIGMSGSTSLAGLLNLNHAPTGTIHGSAQLNKITINLAPINTGTNDGDFGFIEGLVLEHHHGGSGWSGGVNTLSVYSYHDAPTPANTNNSNYVAGTFTQEVVTTDGGTNATGPLNFGGSTGLVWQGNAPKGAFFGANIQVGLRARATNIYNSTGCEFNVYSARCTAQLTTTAGSTAATYSNLVGEGAFYAGDGVAVGQDIIATTDQLTVGTTVAAFSVTSSSTGTVTLSQPAINSSTQAIQFLPNVYYKSIIQLCSRRDDYVKGKYVDAMISLSGQGNARQRTGLLFGNQNGGFPLDDTGTMIGTLGAGTIANVIDVSGWTVSGSLVKSKATNLQDGYLGLTGLNSGIEVGGVGTGVGGSIGYVDFHTGGATDYDARIYATGGTSGANATATLYLLSTQSVIRRGSGATSANQPSGIFAAVVSNANNATAENGLFVKNQWTTATSTILEVGTDAVGGNYAPAFQVRGDRQTYLWDGSQMSPVKIGASGSGPGGTGRVLYI